MYYDVLIAGGGIAGAVCGRLLAKHGFRCAVLERANGPFEKVCGGWLPYKTVRKLELFGLQTNWLQAHGTAVTRGVIIEQNGNICNYPYSHDEYGLGVRRKLLHKFLIDGALEAGCDVYYSTPVTNIQYDGCEYGLRDFTGKYLIMAIGTGCTDNMNKKTLYEGQSFGISEIIRAQTDLYEDIVYFWYPQHLSQHNDECCMPYISSKGYFWAIPIEKNTWNIGWWDIQSANAAKAFQNGREMYVSRHFRNIQTLRRPQGAFCGNRNHISDFQYPVLGAGDFVGCNNPDTGEGIFFALQSAVGLCAGIIQGKS